MRCRRRPSATILPKAPASLTRTVSVSPVMTTVPTLRQLTPASVKSPGRLCRLTRRLSTRLSAVCAPSETMYSALLVLPLVAFQVAASR